jgi:endonuclease/exonuclease/phosphatase family metal-dependent hydrolase
MKINETSKTVLLATMALLAASTLQAADFRTVTCEGTYQHHLQGICADKDAIYWCFTTQLVKTDLNGKLLKKVPVANHHGDLCHHDGKLFVAVKFLKKHVIKSGHTHLGIQTATFANDRWWFGCYGTPKILLVTDADFKLIGRHEYDCSLGVVGLPDGRFLSASGRSEKEVCTGSVRLAVADEKAGLLTAVGQEVLAESLNAMTWNIRYNNPGDGINAWPNRKDWVAEIILKNKADIAGFQEVLVGQLEDFKVRLPQMDAYGAGRDDGKNAGESAPIFFRKDRFELIDKSTFWLSPTPDKPASKGWDAALPRIASRVKLKDRQTGIVFYVMNTHFDHQGTQARAESATLLLKHLREQFADHPVILTGDLNTTPNSPPYNTLIGKGTQTRPVYLDAYEHSVQKPEGPDSTWNGFQAIVPQRRIDFVFTTKSVRVVRFQTLVDQRDGRFPSDHLPVVAELELRKE